MKFSYVFFLAAVLFCGACSKSRKAPNGIEVKVVREGAGEFAAPGQFVVMNMLFKDSKDSVWEDTKKRGIPVIIQVADTSQIKAEKGIESVFRILKKGDSISVGVLAKSLYGEGPIPPTVNGEEKLTFLFGITDVTDRDGIAKLQQEIQSREMAKSMKAQEGQIGMDSVAIDAYLAQKSIIAVKAAKGVRYVVTQEGNGEKPSLSSIIIFKYKGTLLTDGTEFDKSDTPVEYPLSQLVQGWQIAFPNLSKGSKATLYIPSSLGYGASGSGLIPPNANLVFDVELVDFK
ncbi:hypothetical protein BH09BAC3_BH09BAC3_05790 [soil metagenome]